MPLETDTYDIGGGARLARATGSGLVTLFTPDPRGTPPAFALRGGSLVPRCAFSRTRAEEIL